MERPNVPKAASIFIYLQMCAKVNHVVNLKGRKAGYKYPD